MANTDRNLKTATGDWWTDEYNVKPVGVLECPIVLFETTEDVEDGKSKESNEWVVVRCNK